MAGDVRRPSEWDLEAGICEQHARSWTWPGLSGNSLSYSEHLKFLLSTNVDAVICCNLAERGKRCDTGRPQVPNPPTTQQRFWSMLSQALDGASVAEILRTNKPKQRGTAHEPTSSGSSFNSAQVTSWSRHPWHLGYWPSLATAKATIISGLEWTMHFKKIMKDVIDRDCMQHTGTRMYSQKYSNYMYSACIYPYAHEHGSHIACNVVYNIVYVRTTSYTATLYILQTSLFWSSSHSSLGPCCRPSRLHLAVSPSSPSLMSSCWSPAWTMGGWLDEGNTSAKNRNLQAHVCITYIYIYLGVYIYMHT